MRKANKGIHPMPDFQYHPAILQTFPEVIGGVLVVTGIQNGPTPPGLLQAYLAQQQASLTKIGSTPLSELPNLAAWRSAFRKFGVNPTQYRSAIEALLRRLTKKGDIPSINALVDLCNLVSIRHQLPVAAFDTRQLSGAITVQFASGSEQFKPLFAKQYEQPEKGEVIFADPAGLVVARRWCWRQSDESAARPDTRAAILTVEAQHPGGETSVRAAVDDLHTLLNAYTGGQIQTGIIGPTHLAE